MKHVRASLFSAATLALLVPSTVTAQGQKSDTELLVETRNACLEWIRDSDGTPTEQQEFCDCLLLNIGASIPTIPELERLSSDFDMAALSEFNARPQGAQDMGVCFR